MQRSEHTAVKARTPLFCALLACGLLLTPSPAPAQLVSGSMGVHWNEGASDCAANPQPPVQVHPYDVTTFILRENPCSTAEARFMYLLVGSSKALLIDTGDVADPKLIQLAQTVVALLPAQNKSGGQLDGQSKIPLTIVHTHGHLDHRLGDSQFEHLSNIVIVPN